jgi:uncharacterized protein
MDSNLLAVLLVIAAAFMVSGVLFFLKKASVKLSTQVASIIGLYIFSIFILGLTPTELGLGNIRDGMAWGAVISLTATVVLFVASRNKKSRAYFRDERTKNVTKKHVAYRVFIDIPIGTVLFEELLFRGLIYGFFSKTIGVAEAIIVSSTLFGLWHVLPSLTFSKENEKAPNALPTILGTVIFTGLSGIAFAMLRYMSGNIIAPVAFHYAVNTASLLLSWITTREKKDAS